VNGSPIPAESGLDPDAIGVFFPACPRPVLRDATGTLFPT
jgi:hypothetical protein